jgi:uncharacterized membrane protein YagU involved in acid resistance
MRADRQTVRGVVIGGLLAGALDLAFAVSFAAYNGTPPTRLLQTIASGAFGKSAFDGGISMAAAGLVAHFGISVAWAGLYALLLGLHPRLARHAAASGIAFGALVFLAMRLVVLPASAFPFPVSFKPLASSLDLLSHMLLFGLPIALVARRAMARDQAT